MKIEIIIKNNGKSPGTLGWLCENIGEIEIGSTETGKQGAWLTDKSGGIITVLAVRDYWHAGSGIEKVARRESPELCAPRGFTDAAWSIIEELSEIAVSQMEEAQRLSEGVKISINQ